jgi:AAA15 family ATPase/GTPase
MSEYDSVNLLLENYKSFGPGLVGFERIASVNVIGGRNNSGKSALIDLIEPESNCAAPVS